MTASVGSVYKTFALQLNAAVLALSINATNVAFGNVLVNTPATQPVTLTSTGTVPVTINGITLTSTGFTLSGPALPITLTPNQATTVDISFDPTAASAANGQLTISSNASTNSTAVVGLTGTGLAAVAVTPATASTTVGTTQQFAASVIGTSNTAVTWTVAGTGCSGTACGTISSSGLYAAPAAVPSPATVTITATSVLDPSQSASSAVTIVPTVRATYYLAPARAGGNDSNNGRSPNTPWLSPNHAVNCGDVLIAQGGTYASPVVYASANFYNGKWGTVACATGNNVAWVKCSTPFTCSISDTTEDDMFISASYWGVQGWRFSSTASGGCVAIAPSYSAKAEIHHIAMANNIVGPCVYDGIGTNNGYGTTPTVGTDYVAYVGNVVYGAGGASSHCSAGLSFYSPVLSDTLPGTHYYMGGNFVWGNTSNCGDGEGLIFDTFDGVEGGWPTQSPYPEQAVAENNISVWNDGPGIQVDFNENGSGPWAPIYFIHNTVAYNEQGPSDATYCGEIVEGTTVNTNSSLNLVVAPTQYCFGGSTYAHYGDLVAYSTANTIKVDQEFAYSPNGNAVGEMGSTGFTAGLNNITGTIPTLANPVRPGTPYCSGYSTTTACLAPVIANFTPINSAASAYGYQTPQSTPVQDPLFPQWLCTTTNIPAGLVTMGCASE